MALNLRELIKACGGGGAAGQSFKTNVTNATTGVAMSDYRISAVAFSGSVPVDDAGTYPNNTDFAITATFTRGARAGDIQRNVSNAWSFTPRTGPSFTSSIQSFTVNSGGASHSITFRITVAGAGTKSVSPSAAASGSQPPGTDPWPVLFNTNFSLGTGGTALLHIEAAYDPDIANFNPQLNNLDGFDNGWTDIPVARPNYTASDYEFEWHYGAGMVRTNWDDPYDEDVAPDWNTGSRLSTASSFGTAVSIGNRHLVYPDTDPEVGLGTRNTPVQGLAVIWLRWREAGGVSWNYPIFGGDSTHPGRIRYYDSRPAQ